MTEEDTEGQELLETMDPAAYWILDVRGMEWHYIMHTILRNLPEKQGPVQAALFYGNDMQSLTYMLPRKYVSSVLLSKKTGISIEELKKTDRIKLHVTPKDLPNPTVSYWGEA